MSSIPFSPYEVADTLLSMNPIETEPRDLPGRYGRVILSLERLLSAANTESIVAGGWAVWRHGFAGRVTQDVDIVVASNAIKEILRLASLCGFEVLEIIPGRWPKMMHKETGIEVDLMPEGGVPGVPSRPAPVTIQHPRQYGASSESLNFIGLPGLIELKLGAGRVKDQADVIELIKSNRNQLSELRAYLETIHSSYVEAFDAAVQQAQAEEDG